MKIELDNEEEIEQILKIISVIFALYENTSQITSLINLVNEGNATKILLNTKEGEEAKTFKVLFNMQEWDDKAKYAALESQSNLVSKVCRVITPNEMMKIAYFLAQGCGLTDGIPIPAERVQ